MPIKHIIGIDVGSEVSSVAVMTLSGRLKMETRIATSEMNLINLVKSIKGSKQVVFEECGQASWLYSFLEPICNNVFVCDPKKNRDLSGSAKSDDRDAFNLAERARVGALSPVWHGGEKLQALRERLRSYETLTKESTVLKNRIKAVFRGRGIKVGAKVYTNEKERENLKKLLPLIAQREKVGYLFRILDVITEEREKAEKSLVNSAKKNKLYKQLTSIPFIGPFSASAIIAIVGSPNRFRTRGQYWKYVGFSIATYDSSEYCVNERGRIDKKKKPSCTRGLVKQCNKTLKYVYKQAALGLSRNNWKNEFDRLIKSGVRPDNAKLTLARKVAALSLRLMKTGESYEENLVFSSE